MYHVMTHTDLDGVGCGILSKIAFGEKVHVRYHSVGSINRQVERFLQKPPKNTTLIITDLSVSEEVAKKVDDYVKNGGQVILLDHHQSALFLNEYKWATVVASHSEGVSSAATSLLFKYLIEKSQLESSKALEEFVELVRLYDTWEWDQKQILEAKRLNDLFFSQSIDDFEETMVSRLKNKKDSFQFDEFEERFLNVEEDRTERYIIRKKRELIQTFINEECVGIVYAEQNLSELGNVLGKEFPHLDYIALVNVGSRRISMRTIHDYIDVSEIASRYEGGGHPKAAGCIITEDAFKCFVENPFHLEPLKEDAQQNRYNHKSSLNGTLYENRHDDLLFIYQKGKEEWVVEYNQQLDEVFTSFELAERHVKRVYAAWLTRDDVYIGYISQQLMYYKIINDEMDLYSPTFFEVDIKPESHHNNIHH